MPDKILAKTILALSLLAGATVTSFDFLQHTQSDTHKKSDFLSSPLPLFRHSFTVVRKFEYCYQKLFKAFNSHCKYAKVFSLSHHI
mgnify:CR=1 FL=1